MQQKMRKGIALILLMGLCFCQFSEMTFHTVYATEITEDTVEESIAVTELDLGEYQSQMKVGEKQLLTVTVLPMDATEQTVTYASSDSKVAEINGMGRITALSKGSTEISAKCGKITEKFTLTVVAVEDNVRDIDLGDCPKEIEVGESQILSVTVIPTDATEQNVTYLSSDDKIVSVNEIGRVRGVSVGSATITVQCGTVKKDFILNVIKKKSDEIPVKDIEIGDYEDELEVDKTMNLSVTVLPADATHNTVTYKSSDKKIATVNSSGEVKGIKEGKVTISISAGGITKKIKLTVKVATSRIEVNTNYLVMKLGETYQLSARVFPSEADQSILYESVDTDVISVSGGGLVTAKKCGNATVIVKNGDLSTAVTVIVNSDNKEEKKETTEEIVEKEECFENVIYAEETQVVTKEFLKYLYEQGEVLTIYGSGYTMQINGKEIVNWENELCTNLEFKEEKDGVSFNLNRDKKLCGMIHIQFDEDNISGKYVYLYNPSKNKYELLKEKNIHEMNLDTEGKYLITDKELSTDKIKVIMVIIALFVVIVLIGVYIGVKKRYWFW